MHLNTLKKFHSAGSELWDLFNFWHQLAISTNRTRECIDETGRTADIWNAIYLFLVETVE